MKLERIHESVRLTAVVTGGLVLAIALGAAAGSGNLGKVAIVLVALTAIAFLLAIRERVWLLIPATWMLGGKIILLPLPFSVAQLGVIFAFGTFLLLKAFKLVRLKPKFGLVEFWMLLVLVYLGTVFLRNPVGVEALGSERVGGKPYFHVAIACAGFWVLSRSHSSPREAFWMPLAALFGNAVDAFLNLITELIPGLIAPISQVYSGIASAQNLDPADPLPGESDRKNYLVGFGSSMILAACSRWRPLTIVNPLYPLRLLTFLVGGAAVFLSGFRSGLIAALLAFVLASYFRRGVGEVIRVVVPCVLGIGLLIVIQGNVVQLPWAAQRALSFLPGKWDYAAKSDAQGSTEWRMEMWKSMLVGNKYISNKWLGDGFGFTRQQLQVMLANQTSGAWWDMQENFMISGGVHSGPVSTIRFVGYLGLALFFPLLVMVAIRGWKLIRRAQGTPFDGLAIFLGIQTILHPITFVFIFGAYENDLPNVIIAIGMQKMLENSLDAYQAKQQEQAVVAVEAPRKFRRPPQFAPVGRLG